MAVQEAFPWTESKLFFFFPPGKTCLCPSVAAIASMWNTSPLQYGQITFSKTPIQTHMHIIKGEHINPSLFRLLYHISEWHLHGQKWAPRSVGWGRAFLLSQPGTILPCPLFSAFTGRFLKPGISLSWIDLKYCAETLFTVSFTSISSPFPIHTLALEGDGWRWPSAGHCSSLSLPPPSSLRGISSLPSNSIHMVKVGRSEFSYCPPFVQTQPPYAPAATPCCAHQGTLLWDPRSPDLPPKIIIITVDVAASSGHCHGGLKV